MVCATIINITFVMVSVVRVGANMGLFANTPVTWVLGKIVLLTTGGGGTSGAGGATSKEGGASSGASSGNTGATDEAGTSTIPGEDDKLSPHMETVLCTTITTIFIYVVFVGNSGI